jgi:hypothetical protein
MNIIVTILIGVGIFGLYWVWDNFLRMKQGKKILVIIEDLINNQRVFNDIYSAYIRKEDKDSEERVFIPKFKRWYDMPSPKFISHNLKGMFVIRFVDDGTHELSPIYPDSTIYSVKKMSSLEIAKDENGNIIYENKKVLDSHDNEVMESIQSPKRIVYFDYKTDKYIVNEYGKKSGNLYEYKEDFDLKPLAISIEKKIEKSIDVIVPQSFEQIIQANTKNYFISKTREINKDYAIEQKKSFWKDYALPIVAVLIVVGVGIYENKQHRDFLKQETDIYIAFMSGDLNMVKQAQAQQNQPSNGLTPNQILKFTDQILGKTSTTISPTTTQSKD